MSGPTALIADDEPLLRENLRLHLARLWPELQIVAEARNGREAVELFDTHLPQIAFLDVHMPGMSGIEAARAVARRAQIVFVTAYEQYAVQAFEQGAVDYLVKPVDEVRLADTVQRLQAHLATGGAPSSPAALEAVLDRMADELRRRAAPRGWLQWIKASVGASVRLIPVEQVAFLRSDEKYTLVAWDGGEALIRKTIRELADELDPERFAQVHRSVIVNLHRVSQVTRGLNETAELSLTGRSEVLPVSRSFSASVPPDVGDARSADDDGGGRVGIGPGHGCRRQFARRVHDDALELHDLQLQPGVPDELAGEGSDPGDQQREGQRGHEEAVEHDGLLGSCAGCDEANSRGRSGCPKAACDRLPESRDRLHKWPMAGCRAHASAPSPAAATRRSGSA